ncbi:MAG: hypothetical protein V1765_02600 [bacterium]
MNQQLNLFVWAPDKPWILSKTAKYPGKSLEQLMFQDYAYVHQLWSIRQREYTGYRTKDDLHRHLDWLLQTGEKVVAKQLCPQCHKHPVAYYAIISPLPGNSCCRAKACQQKVKNSFFYSESIGLAPMNFSSLLQFDSANIRRQVAKHLFKWAFNIDQVTIKNCWQLFIT